MAENINKVVFAGETLIDLTGDSVTPETLGKGVTAHDKSGAQIVGTMESGGGGGSLPSASKKDVNFYDYDGTILYSYTVAEAAALTELPALPSHDGLICQGWNWSLDGIKAMGRAVNVGAMYITDDGKTRIYITLQDGRTSPLLGCCPNGTVTVDWGDGTEPDVLTGTSISTVKWTPTHEYAAPGDYMISLTVDGTMGFYGASNSSENSAILRYSSNTIAQNLVYLSAVRTVEIGSDVTSIGNNAFRNCFALSDIVIPDSVTSIGNYAFSGCYSLKNIVIPDSVTSIANYVFQNCRTLTNIFVTDGVTSIGIYALQYCYNLSNIIVPNSVRSIGTNAFEYCQNLSNIVIPDGVKSINNNTFQNCYSLKNIVIPDSVTSIGNYTFGGCYSLKNIVIPDGVKSIGYNAFQNCSTLLNIEVPKEVKSINNNTFQNCSILSNIVIPDSVTSIGNYAFGGCYNLTNIFVTDSVTSIGNYAFQNCYGVRYYDFSHHTAVPTLAGTAAFSNIAADCEIRVPAALVDEWRAATNWATYADYIVGV